ncbi:glycosyltransferase [Acetobacteraceae bacterium KSS8]|uniref:Glycosyltransferase n=1 Tax=Endosaccharibacter trunci TaxID=2812733 RepID=A0ABT1W8H9_9PROT|nr:glycosyltransferase [Acetobacteraceae bacterium KSS8]
MRIIVHSAVADRTIKGSLGTEDYSYYFVRLFFAEALRRFADVVEVSDPATEVDPVFAESEAEGEPCLFLSFAPPQKTVLGLRCPVVPVFAWEFSTIPNEVWGEDIRNDWRAVFAVSAGAIALSSYTADIVRKAMGQAYPIAAIPAPVFERFRQEGGRAVAETITLRIAGTVLDTDRVAAFRSAPVWPCESPVPLLTPGPLPALILPADSAPAQPEPPLVGALESVADPVPGPQPDREPEPATMPAEPELVLVPMPVAVGPDRIGWRRRAQITKHFGLEWYRLAVRDLLPRPLRSVNAIAGRTMYRTYRLLRPRHAPPVLGGEGGLGLLSAAPSPDESLMLPRPEADVPADGENRLLLPDGKPEGSGVAAVDDGIAVRPKPAPSEPLPPVARVTLDGVVFTTMFSPRDGRKNWNDIVTAFCWAFRDTPGVTLAIKIVASDYEYEAGLRQLLSELAPLRCRVVVLHGFLETEDYRALIGATTFYANASHCEGLCLPVLEFMSAGVPAIAPDHTAFEDYVTPDNAFVIPSGIENTVWPGDGRDLFRTTRYRIDWHALMLSFREAYRVAREEPERYAAMSANARDTMKGFCAMDRVEPALRGFLEARVAAELERAA